MLISTKREHAIYCVAKSAEAGDSEAEIPSTLEDGEARGGSGEMRVREENRGGNEQLTSGRSSEEEGRG